MIKKLSHSNRAENSLDFLSAPPKRKRGDSIDEISASRQQQENDDDDFVLPLHKRTASSNRLQSTFCLSSYDSEARDGPAEDDVVLDDETEALVKNFRASVFRYEPVSPSSISPSYKEDEDDDDDDYNCMDFPTIGRATTISESSETDDHEDPPDMGSRSSSPLATGEILAQEDHDWSSSVLSLDYRSCRGDEDPIEEARERPEWLSRDISPRSTSSKASQPSSLWNMTQSKDSIWQAGCIGMFHQGSA